MMENESKLQEQMRVDQSVEMFIRQDFSRIEFWHRLVFSVRLIGWVLGIKAQQMIKRGFDIMVASTALILSLPIMLITAIAIKMDSPGPVFFAQVRVGRRGRLFECYKFRSMHCDAEKRLEGLHQLNEADGPIFKMRSDPRVTRVGKFIRKFSIDELPQFINVIKGDMSLVGPRPPLSREVLKYAPEHCRRLDAVPGITGLQQVSGRSDLPFERWVALDIEYIEQQSFWYDVGILLKTIPSVLLGKGAY